MPRYAIAFIRPDNSLAHQVVELDSREAALRFFFFNHIRDGYTPDEEGFAYFKEDFGDPAAPLGNLIEV